MKRVLTLAFALVVMIGITACGNEEEKENSGSAGTDGEKSKVNLAMV